MQLQMFLDVLRTHILWRNPKYFQALYFIPCQEFQIIYAIFSLHYVIIKFSPLVLQMSAPPKKGGGHSVIITYSAMQRCSTVLCNVV